MIRRLVVPGLDLEVERVVLSPEATRYVASVLRLGAGDELLLLDGTGRCARAQIESASKRAVRARIVEVEVSSPPAVAELHLILTLPKGGKPDEIIRRATELGVATISPCLGERSIPRPGADRAERRLERWRRIAAEASRQCQRTQVPEVRPILALEGALREASDDALRLILSPDEARPGLIALLSALSPDQPVVLAIGPEGGFSMKELELATTLGYQAGALGPLVLRVETAAIAACALAQAALGGLDPSGSCAESPKLLSPPASKGH